MPSNYINLNIYFVIVNVIIRLAQPIRRTSIFQNGVKSWLQIICQSLLQPPPPHTHKHSTKIMFREHNLMPSGCPSGPYTNLTFPPLDFYSDTINAATMTRWPECEEKHTQTQASCQLHVYMLVMPRDPPALIPKYNYIHNKASNTQREPPKNTLAEVHSACGGEDN